MVHVWQKLFFDGRIVATDNTNPDFVMLAKVRRSMRTDAAASLSASPASLAFAAASSCRLRSSSSRLVAAATLR